LVKLEIKGEDLIRAFENGVSRYPSLEGRWPCIAGASFVFDPTVGPLKRVVRESVKIGGFDVVNDKLYSVCCKGFVA